MRWVLFLSVSVVVGVSFLPVDATQPTPFADPSFSRYFSRANPTGQALLWGGAPLVSIVEPYTSAPGNRRLVQYFDRGRMELDAVTGKVSQGLLVRELTTGTIQLGDDTFEQSSPAAIPILANSANDGIDAGPTYADFAARLLERSPDGTQQQDSETAQWLMPGGEIVSSTAPIATVPALYVEQTGHNVPDITAAWFAGDPFGALSWQDALGYPVSEAYWVQADGAERLVQLFERRVVVYTPALPEGERFSLSNAGRHYYRWRYGAEPGGGSRPQLSSAPDQNDDVGLVLPQGYQAEALLTGATDIVDLAVAPDGQVLLAHASGVVTAIDPTRNSKTTVIDGLSSPAAVVSVDTTIYVVDAAGMHRFHDIDLNGVIDGSDDPVPLPFDPATVLASAGPGGTLYVAGVERDGSNAGMVTLLRWDNALGALERVPAAFDGDGVFVIDIAGSIWAADPTGELVRFSPDEPTRSVLSLQGLAEPTPTLEASVPGTNRTIRDLLLYRPDGTIGDPLSDMLALVSDADGGRLVRLQPAADAASVATPATNSLSGAIVDFITGFKDPVAVVAGLDGCIYVADDGSGILYRITPP